MENTKDCFSKEEVSKIYKEKIEYCRREIIRIKNDRDKLLKSAYKYPDSQFWFIEMCIEDYNKDIKFLERKTISWDIKNDNLFGVKREYKNYVDISTLKEIPISYLVPQLKEYSSNRYKCCCPMHNEKTPSFNWMSDENIYHCFGCNKHGDIINLYMELNKCDFKRACSDLQKML